MNEVKDWKWATVFIEIALRAIRRVHYDHGMWGVGRQWEMNRIKAGRLNMGHGIELADERTVCAAITQEFITSPSVTGLWVPETEDGERPQERYFTIDREKKYTDGSKKVDIFIQKYERKNKGQDPTPVPEPSFIEAKRHRLWVPEITSGEAKREAPQVKNVKDDIERLRNEMKAQKEKIHCHVLVWGLYDKDSPKDDPIHFFKNFGDNVKMHQLRWLPTKWTSPSIENIQNEDIEIPLVSKALWIVLAEVFKVST